MPLQTTIERLREMRLRGTADALVRQQQQPELQSLSFEERLELLVDQEWLDRQNRRLARLLKETPEIPRGRMHGKCRLPASARPGPNRHAEPRRMPVGRVRPAHPDCWTHRCGENVSRRRSGQRRLPARLHRSLLPGARRSLPSWLPRAGSTAPFAASSTPWPGPMY